MAFYRLKHPIQAHKLSPLSGPSAHPAQVRMIAAGEVVEAVTAPNTNGRVLIRYAGECYRMWKEDLQNSRMVERIPDLAVSRSGGINA